MNAKTLVLFTRNGLGDAPDQLQQQLAAIFFNLLAQDAPPGVLAFYGGGVRLACTGSPVLAPLKLLAERGCTLILCQTCLDYFALRAAVEVGIIGSMADIVTAMNQANKVISV